MRPDGWGENDAIIRCHRISIDAQIPGVTVVECELCGASIAAAPVSAEKRGTPGWHLVCPSCLGKILPDNQMKFMGRIQRGDEKLP